MKILALDTSTEYCSVALWQDGALIEHSERVGQQHSERLIAMIDDLLKSSGCEIQDMNGIAYGAGPGSFTGVRIACGVTQGLALGTDLPVAGICTLLALAQACAHTRVIAALDARMGEIYCAVYESVNSQWITVCEPCLCRPEDAPVVSGTGWFAAGSGFSMAALLAQYAGQLGGMNDTIVPQAGAIATLAAIQFTTGNGLDAKDAQPFYLRNKVALKTCERENPATL
jgi:tRNA threonylcarbamoyladenosine biosynthesis protein TsaB